MRPPIELLEQAVDQLAARVLYDGKTTDTHPNGSFERRLVELGRRVRNGAINYAGNTPTAVMVAERRSMGSTRRREGTTRRTPPTWDFDVQVGGLSAGCTS